MASKTRIANKTKWALEDIKALCIESKSDWRQLVALSEQRLDPHVVLLLAKLRDKLSDIQHIASEAAEGRYNE